VLRLLHTVRRHISPFYCQVIFLKFHWPSSSSVFHTTALPVYPLSRRDPSVNMLPYSLLASRAISNADCLLLIITISLTFSPSRLVFSTPNLGSTLAFRCFAKC
jgi:hypothetical protein